MDNNYNYAIERLNKIKWAELGKKEEYYQIILVGEYFRRVSKLQMDLIPEKARAPYFPYGIGELLEIKFNIEKPNIDIFKLVPEIKENLNPAIYGNYAEHYIELAILLDRDEPLAIKYRDVYEPLIKLFESRGCFYFHDGLIHSGGGALPKGQAPYYANRKELDVSDEALKKYKKDHINKIKNEMITKARQMSWNDLWYQAVNKPIKVLGNSMEDMNIQVENFSDEEVIECLYTDNIDAVINATFEIAERRICNERVINALIDYSRYMDKSYTIYSNLSLGHLALAVLHECDDEIARSSYAEIISNIDDLDRRRTENIIRWI